MNDYIYIPETSEKGTLKIYIPPAKNCTRGSWLCLNCYADCVAEQVEYYSKLYPQR